MDPTPTTNQTSAITIDPNQRSQAMADARRRSTEQALARSEANSSARAETRESVRALLQDAVGANTRITVTRSQDSLTFNYRAVDIETGTVVHEWPPAQLKNFLAEKIAAGEAVNIGELGTVLDDIA